LNIAKAKDIIPAKAIYKTRPPEFSKFSQNFITQTGHVKPLNDHFIFDLSKDTRFFHNFQSAVKVKST